MHIEGFFDPSTGSNSYLVFDGDRARVAVVDSVLVDFPSAFNIHDLMGVNERVGSDRCDDRC